MTVLKGDTIEIIKGDSYLSADGTSLIWTEPYTGYWPDLTGATSVTIKIGAFSTTGAILTSGTSSPQVVGFDLTAAQTGSTTNLILNAYEYQVYATYTGSIVHSLVKGIAKILRFG